MGGVVSVTLPYYIVFNSPYKISCFLDRTFYIKNFYLLKEISVPFLSFFSPLVQNQVDMKSHLPDNGEGLQKL